MLKMSITFYSSMMLILSFVLMTLIIGIEVKNIDYGKISQNHKVVSSEVSEPQSKVESNLKISTDKKIYLSGEDVTVTFENLAANKMVEKEDSNIVVKTRPDMGKNYEVAFIEKKEGPIWVAIEPLSRCSLNCNESCPKDQVVAAKGQKTFTWAQTLFICSEDGFNNVKKASSGEYRISSATWDKKQNKNIVISSNNFKISNISKK